MPVVALTANVSRPLMGTDAFQEVDFYTLTIPVTKHNFLVEAAEDLFRVLPEAFRLAEVGGAAVVAGIAQGNKCQRCWQVLTEVGQDAAHPDLCRRCTAAVAA